MKSAPSFLGYSRLSAEVTAGLSITGSKSISLPEHPVPGRTHPGITTSPVSNQWPSPSVLPEFRPIFTDYMARMGAMSISLHLLIAEAIELPADAFDKYFDDPPSAQQHKLKIVKYPVTSGR